MYLSREKRNDALLPCVFMSWSACFSALPTLAMSQPDSLSHSKENAVPRTGPFLAPPSGPGSWPSQQHQQVLLTACCPRLIRMIHAAEKTRTCTVATHSCKKSGPFSFRGSCVIHLASVSFRTKHSPDLFYLLHVTVQ